MSSEAIVNSDGGATLSALIHAFLTVQDLAFRRQVEGAKQQPRTAGVTWVHEKKVKGQVAYAKHARAAIRAMHAQADEPSVLARVVEVANEILNCQG